MNNFQNIDFVKQLPLLKIIDARWNRIEEISNFNENRNLETILLDGNSIIRVPFQKILFNLKRLKLFSIFKNACINYFSAIIYRFSTLDVRILDLSRCNIQFIPQEISLLPFLFELNVCSLSHFCYLSSLLQFHLSIYFIFLFFIFIFYFLFFISYFLFFYFLFIQFSILAIFFPQFFKKISSVPLSLQFPSFPIFGTPPSSPVIILPFLPYIPFSPLPFQPPFSSKVNDILWNS